MSSTGEKVRQLAPHWAVMFVAMFAALAVADPITGGLGVVASLVLVLAIAFAYPFAVRTLGVAPAVWRR
ncbi:hypothetical protein [Halorubrum sp. CGM4_25_10-8A]|uniref:hypothetical protein n=1 Tax=Halorubrum sp. CGM4_25_10-8A TaxID=2518116 RepID=UPI0010F90C61|nr:hypothetical protein [Halorubrum sp. CGM4_25_10-8A]TKX35759.1 hypothetical protein EXE52_17710 [Halorubrum sp. CGM4_25_10-8A]